METHSEYPAIFARFYDLIYNKIRQGIDNDYFLEQIRLAKGPVLELGVGTGRFFMDALAQGADIYGVDVSRSMLEVLKKKLPGQHHHRIWHMDAADMKLPLTFDLVIAPFRMMSHVNAPPDQIHLLNNVYEHLNPGGTFIFDLYVPNLKMLDEGIQRQVDFEGEYEPGRKIRRITSMHADLISQLSHVTMEFEWDEQDGLHNEAWTFDMRFYFRYELEHLVARSKLRLEKILGDYAGNELNGASKDFILVCRREDSMLSAAEG